LNVAAPVAKTIYGAAPAGFSQAQVTAVISALAPREFRAYDNPVPDSWVHTNDAHLIPTGVIIFESVKAPVVSLAAGDPTQVADVKAILAGMPGGIFCDQHEPENPAKGIDPVKYQADWLALLDLIEAENATRDPAHHIEPVPTFMAWSLDPASGRDIWGTWFPKDPKGRIKYAGFDIYRTSEIALSTAFCTAHGFGLYVPEYGYEVGSTPPTDDQYVARMANDSALFDAYGTKAVLLFDSGGNSVANLPKATAFWRSLCTR
jgi:hypothetical protein